MKPALIVTHRIDQVDKVKAVAMLLVLIGHAPGLDPLLMNIIYAFHMPVFFFLSGLLLSEKKLALPFGKFVAAQFRSLGIPYLFFFGVSYLYWLPTHQLSAATLKHGPYAWWEPLLGFLQGGQEAWIINAVLWFFVCLFMTSCIYFIARKFSTAKFLAFVFSGMAIVFVLRHADTWPRWPWMLDSAVIALGFYAVGHWMYGFLASWASWPRTRLAVGAVLLGAGLVLGAVLNGKVDLNFLQFGSFPWVYFLDAYLGIFALWCICLLLPTERLFTWIANNTLVIFPSHLLFYSLFTGIGVVALGWPHDFKESSWIWAVLFPLLALTLSYPLSLILTRYLPSLFGRRRVHASATPKHKPSAPNTITPAFRR